MKLELLGLNHFDSRSATCQTVTPPSPARSSVHLSIAPPQLSSAKPRLSLYQAARRLWSDVDLKKTPPIPVTRAITAPRSVVHCRRKRKMRFVPSSVSQMLPSPPTAMPKKLAPVNGYAVLMPVVVMRPSVPL